MITAPAREHRRRFPSIAIAMVAIGCGEPTYGGPRGDVTFAVLGDAPYYRWEERQYDHLVAALDRDSLDFVIHVGDLFWRPCSAAKMRERLGVLQRMRHPLIFVPGDNEWTDCWGRREGGYDPLGRLDTLRSIYFPEPGRSLGGRPIALETQSSHPAWPEFVEHQRWTAAGVVFATVHLVGSRNGLEDFPGRTRDHDAAVARRTAAATAWVTATFGQARRDSADAVFVAMHAEPGFTEPVDDPYRQSYEPFLETLEREVARFDGPVVLAHGDSHELIVDQPLHDRTTGRALDNFTRLEVMGSPAVGWVRVVMDAHGPRFDFTPLEISRWRIR